MLRKNKNLRVLVFKQKSALEAGKRESLELAKRLHELEAQLRQAREGERESEAHRRAARLKQKLRTLERVFTKEKDEGLRLKRELAQTKGVLAKGGLTRVRRVPQSGGTRAFAAGAVEGSGDSPAQRSAVTA